MRRDRLRQLPERERSSTTWAGSPSTAPTRTWPTCWSRRSHATLVWMRDQGVRFAPIYGRQAFRVDGRFTLLGRARPSRRSGGGPGLVECAAPPRGDGRASRSGYERRALGARRTTTAASTACGVRHRRASDRNCSRRRRGAGAPAASRPTPSGAPATSGPGWDLAKVRGTRFNTGDGIRDGAGGRRAAVRQLVGLPRGAAGTATPRSSATWPSATASRSTAIRSGSWSTPAASASSTRAPTSATTPTPSTARVVLAQPGQFAWQVFDAKVAAPAARRVPHPAGHQGHGRHARGAGRRARGRRPGGVPARRSARYNAAVRRDVPFDPNVKDGRGTRRPGRPEVELGEHARHAAVRGLCGHLRHHLHLRRRADRHRRRRWSTPTASAIPGLYACRRDGRRDLLLQLPGRYGPDHRRGVRAGGRAATRPSP